MSQMDQGTTLLTETASGSSKVFIGGRCGFSDHGRDPVNRLSDWDCSVIVNARVSCMV